jgi:hypothetical protein
MDQPREIPGARICVLVHDDEVVICANIAGFKALGEWIAWLAASDPGESFHLHLLWHLESEASRFEDVRPRNVWVLRTPAEHRAKVEPPEGMDAATYEVTFQVVRDTELDELALAQEDGAIPERYRKQEASYVNDV